MSRRMMVGGLGVLAMALAFYAGRSMRGAHQTTASIVPETVAIETTYPLDIEGMIANLIDANEASLLAYANHIEVTPLAEGPDPPYHLRTNFSLQISLGTYTYLPDDWRWQLLYARWIELNRTGALKHALANPPLRAPFLFDTWVQLDSNAALHALAELREQPDIYASSAIIVLSWILKNEAPTGITYIKEHPDLLITWERQVVSNEQTTPIFEALARDDLAFVRGRIEEFSGPFGHPGLHPFLRVWSNDPHAHQDILNWLWEHNDHTGGLDILAKQETVNFETVAKSMLQLPFGQRRISWITYWLRLWHEQHPSDCQVWIEHSLNGWLRMEALAWTTTLENWEDLRKLDTEDLGLSQTSVPETRRDWSSSQAPFSRSILRSLEIRFASNFHQGLQEIALLPDVFTQSRTLQS
ncbi:MAG: hypothetical protein ACI9DF_005082 [Verrucomicrobiales bacterium]|jgi:hypothetical protein